MICPLYIDGETSNPCRIGKFKIYIITVGGPSAQFPYFLYKNTFGKKGADYTIGIKKIFHQAAAASTVLYSILKVIPSGILSRSAA